MIWIYHSKISTNSNNTHTHTFTQNLHTVSHNKRENEIIIYLGKKNEIENLRSTKQQQYILWFWTKWKWLEWIHTTMDACKTSFIAFAIPPLPLFDARSGWRTQTVFTWGAPWLTIIMDASYKVWIMNYKP